MAAEQNMAVVRRYVEEGFNAGSMDALDEVFAPDFVNHDPGNPAVRDLEGLKESVRMLHQAFPDVHTSIDALLTDGDCVIKRFTLRGTQQGEFNGIPPTGKQITLEGIDIMRVSEGKIQEIWMGVDYLTMLQQLSVIPQPETVGV
jgi:steroid delta-isomerase-like uncharacterized protein